MLKKYPKMFITYYVLIIGATPIKHMIDELKLETKLVAQKSRRFWEMYFWLKSTSC